MTENPPAQPDCCESQQLKKERKRTPLPKMQLAAVCWIQLAEPITATVIYPFIPQFIADTGITGGDEKKTGYYAGIIESVFFLAECLSVYHWAKASNKFGRRPVLLLAPLGLAFAMFGFGLSSKFWPLVVFRCAQGVFNGDIGVSKTVLAEISDSTNIGDAMSIIPIIWSVGVIAGPLMGGILARPAVTWPNSFGKIALFRVYPYLLPCAAAGMLCICCFIFAFFLLKETHVPQKKLKKIEENDRSSLQRESIRHYGAIETLTTEPVVEERPLSFTELLRDPRVATAMICYGFLAFGEMAYGSLIPLVWSTSIPTGGLGFNPQQIGTIMGSVAIVEVGVQLLFFPALLRRFGPRNMFIVSLFGMVVANTCLPLSTYIAKQAGEVTPLVVIVLVVQLICALSSYMAFTAIQVIVVGSSPNKASLATTNGLGQAVGCFVRSLAPMTVSSLFSISLEQRLLGGYMVYAIVLGVMSIGIWVCSSMPKDPKDPRI